MRVEAVLLDRRTRRRAVAIHPAIQGFAVEQQLPAIPAFSLGERVVGHGRERLHADIAVTNELLGEIAATVNLERNAAGIGMSFRGFLPVAKLHAIRPGGDVRRIADDARAQFVPLSMPPEFWPIVGPHGKRRGERSDDLLDLVGRIQKFEKPTVSAPRRCNRKTRKPWPSNFARTRCSSSPSVCPSRVEPSERATR